VQFLASFDEHVVNLLGFSGLGFWNCLTHDVIHIGQNGKLSAVAAEMAEIRSAVGEQDSLVGVLNRTDELRMFPIMCHAAVTIARTPATIQIT